MADIPKKPTDNVESQRTGGKRKRATLSEQEIEVDVSAPEPPSKKALRKAKKQKTQDKPSTPGLKKEDARDRKDLEEDSDEETPAAPVNIPKAVFSIWVGNLSFSITKSSLQKYLCENTQPPIQAQSITRINIPAPNNAKATQTSVKPRNKGFAYVDFADQQSFTAALALTETEFGGRNLLIKDARNFEGRPEDKAGKVEESKTAKAAAGGQGQKKEPTRRIFVGNLGFDATQEDLRSLYAPCGNVVDVHMATFQDTGKCKGFAWVTFDEVAAAEAAVRGWTKVKDKPEDPAKPAEGEAVSEDEQSPADGKTKMRKWFVNRLLGRTVRCEFAEAAASRYKKRFGKDARGGQRDAGAAAVSAAGREIEEVPAERVERNKYGIAPGAPSDRSMRRGRNAKDHGDEKRKQMQDESRYRTGALTKSKGSKVTFD